EPVDAVRDNIDVAGRVHSEAAQPHCGRGAVKHFPASDRRTVFAIHTDLPVARMVEVSASISRQVAISINGELIPKGRYQLSGMTKLQNALPAVGSVDVTVRAARQLLGKADPCVIGIVRTAELPGVDIVER